MIFYFITRYRNSISASDIDSDIDRDIGVYIGRDIDNITMEIVLSLMIGVIIGIVTTFVLIRWIYSHPVEKIDDLVRKDDEIADERDYEDMNFDELFKAIYKAFSPRRIGTWKKEAKFPKLLENWISENIRRGMWKKLDDTTYRVYTTQSGKPDWIFHTERDLDDLEQLFIKYLEKHLIKCCIKGGFSISKPHIDDYVNDRSPRSALEEMRRRNIIDFIIPHLREYYQQRGLYKLRIGFYYSRKKEFLLMGPSSLICHKRSVIHLFVSKMTPVLKRQIESYPSFLSSEGYHLRRMMNRVNFPFVLIKDEQGLNLDTWGSMTPSSEGPGEIPDGVKYVGLIHITPSKMKTFDQFCRHYKLTECSICGEETGTLTPFQTSLGLEQVTCLGCIIQYMEIKLNETSPISNSVIQSPHGNANWVIMKDDRILIKEGLGRIPLVMKFLRAFQKRMKKFHDEHRNIADFRETKLSIVKSICDNGGIAILCPGCEVVLVKDGGCNSVICTHCLTESCFDCKKIKPTLGNQASDVCKCSTLLDYVEIEQRENAIRQHAAHNHIPPGMICLGHHRNHDLCNYL